MKFRISARTRGKAPPPLGIKIFLIVLWFGIVSTPSAENPPVLERCLEVSLVESWKPAELTGPITVSAMVTDPYSETWLLIRTPAMVIWLKGAEKKPVIFDGRTVGLNLPDDMLFFGLGTLLLCQPSRSGLFRLERNRGFLTPMEIQSREVRFEPISACADRSGKLFVLNRADSDIYRIESDGSTFAFRLGLGGSGWLAAPIRIRYVPDLEKLVILEPRSIKLCTTTGKIVGSIEHGISRAAGLNVAGSLAWVAGMDMGVIDMKNMKPVKWRWANGRNPLHPEPLADLSAPNDSTLRIVLKNHGTIAELKILPVPQVKE